MTNIVKFYLIKLPCKVKKGVKNMFEKEMDELRAKNWMERYERLDVVILNRMESRKENELLYSFSLLLSGFGGSADASKYLRGKLAENA